MPVAAGDAAAVVSMLDMQHNKFVLASRCFVLCEARCRLAGKLDVACLGICHLKRVIFVLQWDWRSLEIRLRGGVWFSSQPAAISFAKTVAKLGCTLEPLDAVTSVFRRKWQIVLNAKCGA